MESLNPQRLLRYLHILKKKLILLILIPTFPTVQSGVYLYFSNVMGIYLYQVTHKQFSQIISYSHDQTTP